MNLSVLPLPDCGQNLFFQNCVEAADYCQEQVCSFANTQHALIMKGLVVLGFVMLLQLLVLRWKYQRLKTEVKQHEREKNSQMQ